MGVIELANGFEKVVDNAIEDKEFKSSLEQMLDSAPLVYIGATIVCSNVNGVKDVEIIFGKGGVLSPQGTKAFPPKMARDEAAKEFAKLLRKKMIKTQDALAAGKHVHEGETFHSGTLKGNGRRSRA